MTAVEIARSDGQRPPERGSAPAGRSRTSSSRRVAPARGARTARDSRASFTRAAYSFALSGGRRHVSPAATSSRDRAFLGARLPPAPFFPRLAPQVHAIVFERRGQFARAQISRAQLLRDALGRNVLRRDRVNHVVPPERVERPVGCGGRSLTRVASAPAVADDRPADFSPRPSFRLPRTEPSDPAAGVFLDHREHRKALRVPRADHRHQLPPAQRLRYHAADEPRRRLVGHHLRQRVEIPGSRRAKDQSRRFQSQVVERWHGWLCPRSRSDGSATLYYCPGVPVASWWTGPIGPLDNDWANHAWRPYAIPALDARRCHRCGEYRGCVGPGRADCAAHAASRGAAAGTGEKRPAPV